MERADYWATVQDQDRTLAATAAAVRRALAAADLPIWGAGEVLDVVAMGASTMAAEYLVHEARQQGRVVLNWSAADWRAAPRLPGALAIGISESGRSPETIDALERFAGHRIVLTNVEDAPVAEVADTLVPLGPVADAGVYVSGYTSTLVALALVGRGLGLRGLTDDLDDVPGLVRDWLPAATAAVDEFLGRHFPGTPLASVDCVGAGASFASAAETALLLREAGRTPSAFFATDQYLHGPAEAMPGAFGAVVFGGGRADELVRLMVEAGFAVLHVSAAPVPGAVGAALPTASPLATSVLEVLVGQVLSGRLGDRSGHEIGTFRHEFAGTKLPVIAG